MRKSIFLREINSCLDNEEITCVAKVIHIRKLGKLQFLVILDQTGKCQCIIDNKTRMSDKIEKGSFVEITGLVATNENDRKEIQVKELAILGVKNKGTDPRNISYGKVEKLILRSRIVELILRFFSEKGFLPVSSPTIVGNWVEGKTHAFTIDYFGRPCYLTLNNMLYHQVLLISGFSKIYEISKVFRKDASNPRNRLTEFFSVDISVSDKDGSYVMKTVEEMIRYVLCAIDGAQIYKDVVFDYVTYSELMNRCGCVALSGAQLNSKATRYLKENYKGFVWITNFPEEKRRFFVKSEDGYCNDYQLWYNGECQIAAGSEREQSLEELKRKIIQEDKKIEQYEEFLKYFENSVPPMAEIGFGVERFIMFVLGCKDISEVVAFPRNKKTFEL